MSRTDANLVANGIAYADYMITAFERLCGDDGNIGREDLAAFERWHADRVEAVERELRAEGATEADVCIWRKAWHDQISIRTEVS